MPDDQIDLEEQHHRERIGLIQGQYDNQINQDIDAEGEISHSCSSKDDYVNRNYKDIQIQTNSRGESIDIFNPFKRKKAAMKFDYRRETCEPRSRNTVRQAADCRKTYLFVYNLMMFIGFLFVFLVLLIKTVSRTLADDTIEAACSIIKLLTFLQYLETIHCICGLVPSGAFVSFAQATGRLIVILFLSQSDIRMNSAPYVFYMLAVWSAIEIIRYPFYALRVFSVNIGPLTWLRYSLFLPLYPLGGLCESMVITQCIYRFEETGEYSISMPNRLNISFYTPTALRVYVVLILPPSIYLLMKYMWSQRKKQLASKDKQE